MQAITTRMYSLKLKYIQMDFDTLIAVAISISTPVSGQTRLYRLKKKDYIISEIFQEVQSLTFDFTGFFQEKIVQIFHNQFKPINFDSLYYMQGYYYKILYDKEQIGIEDKMLRLKKIFETYKNFEKLFYKFQLENYINYIFIIVPLFVRSIVELNVAFNSFYSNIFQLLQVYGQQKTVFSFAIEVHIHIILLWLFDQTKWDILLAFQRIFYNALILFSSVSFGLCFKYNKLKQSYFSPSEHIAELL